MTYFDPGAKKQPKQIKVLDDNARCKTKCPSNKICNPVSGKCVLRTGAIGKRLLAARQ